MTIDEAIKHSEEVAKKQENNAKSYPRPDKRVKGSGRMYNAYLKCAEEHRQLAEWLKDYRRLLEQETCDDCISRKEALSHEQYTETEDGWTGYTVDSDIIKQLPPVQLKMGHWEWVQYDGNPNIGNWHCSECRSIVNYEPTYNWEKKPYHKFCPMCGAKMEEVEDDKRRSTTTNEDYPK